MGLAFHYGMGGELLDFVFAHGLLELSVIFLAGGAGLQIGHAVINPGRHTWRAVPLIMLAIPALAAGLIESFISPTESPFVVKVWVGLGAVALLYGYLFYIGAKSASGIGTET